MVIVASDEPLSETITSIFSKGLSDFNNASSVRANDDARSLVAITMLRSISLDLSDKEFKRCISEWYYIEPTSHAILRIRNSHTDTIFPN